jgi:hypothetical protein
MGSRRRAYAVIGSSRSSLTLHRGLPLPFGVQKGVSVKMNATTALSSIPEGLRTELLEEYGKIVRNYQERRWQAAELNGGRFCEITYSIVRGYASKKFPDGATKPQNFPESCRRMEVEYPRGTVPQSIRISIPRILIGLYEIRNNRGVGHVGGDVDANHMDATYVLHAVKWIMAELVRIFHETDTGTASAAVESLVERTLPILWDAAGTTRVLDQSLSLREQTLLLLYATSQGLSETTLAASLDQTRISDYRRVLRRLHQTRLADYNRATGQVLLSPLGIQEVEQKLFREDK